MVNSPATIWWIEKLLQTPIDDYRKYAVWRILVPYLVNIRRLAGDETNDIILRWLDKCNSLRQLDFDPNSMIRRNISTVNRGGYLPIRLEKLKIECTYLHRIVTLGQCLKS
jgi:non-catalytic primase subunit PriX-like protein